MSFRYKIEEISKNGTVNSRAESFDKTEILVGRGSGNDILLESSFVSLTHAKFVITGGNLAVEDLGSLSGLKVNDRVLTSQQLKPGDTVKVGDITFLISKEGADWVALEKRTEVEKVDVEAQVKKDVTHLSLFGRLPSYTLISLFLSLLVLGLFFALPMARGKKDTWSSGPLSNKHAVFSGNCETCHTAPFTPVKSDACMSCHQMTKHSELLPASDKREGDCTTCHIEHEGDTGLTVRKESNCAKCHGNIQHTDAKAKTKDVPAFDKHPEIASRTDESNVKLNHEIHLKGPIRSNEGLKTLQCNSCHEIASDGRAIRAINFKKDCQSCHSLGFDPRMADKSVPHGNNPNEIYKFLYAEYAKFYGSQGKLDAAVVERDSREAEQMLFTRTACQLCHVVKDNTEASPEEIVKSGKSKFVILPPKIPTQWLTKARFSHGAHDAVQCESCHKGVRASTKTADVLLPKLAQCQSCHASAGGNGKKHFVKSDCTMCHSYHDKAPLEPSRQQKIEELLASAH